MQITINEKRLLDTFLTLVRIDSQSFQEGKIHQYVVSELKKAGCSVYVDKAGTKIGSDAPGNIIATLKGTRRGKPFLLAAHLDTVHPGNGVKPVVKNGRVFSDGTTILGGDDKSGVAVMLELARTLQECKPDYNGVQFIFTLNEENGMGGAKNLDYSKIKGTDGLLLDNEGLGELLVQGPEAHSFMVTIHGVAAHAGASPEKGISALEVAAYAISNMKLGRVDQDTVCNFGIVEGGQATNMVMPLLTLKGEVRSLQPTKLQKQIKHMKDCFAQAAKAFTKRINGQTIRPKIVIKTAKRYDVLRISKNAPAVRLLLKEAKKRGIVIHAVSSGGGCDANVMSAHGLVMPDMGLGVQNCHSTQEYLDLREFYLGACLALDVLLAYK